MINAETSTALALAIGYHPDHVFITASMCLAYTGNPHDKVRVNGKYWVYNHRIFDHMDWHVAGPIAERYDCSPAWMSTGSWMTTTRCGSVGEADTPQKAIASAVIGAKK